eukprot:scpid45238/ scgid4261/ Probable G-protein coupled receptor 112
MCCFTLPGVCPEETVMDQLFGDFVWPETSGNASAVLRCPASNTGGSSDQATRKCVLGDSPVSADNPFWSAQDVFTCPYLSQRTTAISDIAKIVFNTSEPSTVLDAGEELGNLTNVPSQLTTEDVRQSVIAFDNLVNSVSEGTTWEHAERLEVASFLVEVVDNLLDVPATEVNSDDGYRLITLVDFLATSLSPVENETKLVIHSDNLALAVLCPTEPVSQGLRASSDTGVYLLGSTENITKEGDVKALAVDIAASTIVEATDELALAGQEYYCPLAQPSFVVYNVTDLFNDTTLDNSTFLATQVVTVNVGKTPRPNLTDPILLAFPFNRFGLDLTEINASCVFWDNATVSWSTEGCRTVSVTSRHVRCQCDHLTNFAVLVSRSIANSIRPLTQAERVMNMSTYIGMGISVLGLVIATIIILTSSSMCSKAHYRIILALCFNLLLIYAIIYGGMRSTSRPTLCYAVAVLLHYLILTMFACTSADATMTYVKLVRVVGAQPSSLLCRLLSAVLGLPLLIVVITASVSKMTAYKPKQFCWMTGHNAFYVSFVAPMALSLLYNMCVLGLVVRSLRQRQGDALTGSRMGKATRGLSLLRTIVFLSILFGLTWTTGVLVIIYDHLALQYLFAILNSLQGFLLFLYISRDKDTQRRLTQKVSTLFSLSKPLPSQNAKKKSPIDVAKSQSDIIENDQYEIQLVLGNHGQKSDECSLEASTSSTTSEQEQRRASTITFATASARTSSSSTQATALSARLSVPSIAVGPVSH